MSQLPIENLPAGFPTTFPSVAINGELIFMGLMEGGQIFLRTSQVGGNFWSDPITVPNATSPELPAIACVEGRLYVAWMASDGSQTLYYTTSFDNGQSFEPVTQVSDVVMLEAPAMIGGSNAMVIFRRGDQVAAVVLP